MTSRSSGFRRFSARRRNLGGGDLGTDEHFSLAGYEFFHKVAAPPVAADLRAALTLVPSLSRPISH